jgi:hypothetical protein
MATTEKPELSAIDILRNAANLKPMRKVVILSNGSEFEFWHTPLTEAERSRLTKDSAEESGGFAMQVLIQKALNESGERLFAPGHIASLRRETRDTDLREIQNCILLNEKSEYYDPNPKP